jgi:hypothetical protein
VNEPGINVGRGRGKSPQQCAFFSRSVKHKEETSLLASVCSLPGALPRTGVPVNRVALANISRGELLCQAFEVYLEWATDPRISFENLVLLVSALAQGEELMLANCDTCGALTVVDRVAIRAQYCPYCPGKDH